MELHPIKTEQDYAAALRAIEALWTAPAGSPEAEQLEILVTLVERAFGDSDIPQVTPL